MIKLMKKAGKKAIKIVIIVIVLFLVSATGITFSLRAIKNHKNNEDTTNVTDVIEVSDDYVEDKPDTIEGEYFENQIGTVTIEKIGLIDKKIFEGIDNEFLAQGIGHFTSSSMWDGNVALAAHNRRRFSRT